MPDARYSFICNKTSADFVIPSAANSLPALAVRVSNFAKGLVGGVLRAGDILDRPTQTPIANHLLCDGSLQEIASFPQLYAALGTTFGGDGLTTFGLPDYSGALTITTPTVTQEVSESGTVQTGDTVVTDEGDTGGTTGGNVVTGGRQRKIISVDE